MPRSDWNILAPVTGLAALFTAHGLGAYTTALDNPEQGYPRYSEARDEAAGAQAPSAIDLAKAGQYRTPCHDTRSAGESDLCAQWRAAQAAEESAMWTRWGFFAGLFGLFGLWRQVVLTRRAVEDTGEATKAMGEANAIASDTAKRQLRAYCNLLEYEGTGVALDNDPQFIFTIANTGQTPAKLRVDSACWITTVGQMNYSADVWLRDELTVGAGKTIKPIANLWNKISQTEWDGLVEGTLVLCAGVYGEYTDIFGDPQSFKSIGYAVGLTGQFSLRSAPGGQYST